MPADPRALGVLGALVRTLRERSRIDAEDLAATLYPRLGPCGKRDLLWRMLEDGSNLPTPARLEPLVIRLAPHATPAERDALYAAAGLVPPDVAALAADPARWATLRASDATARVVAAARALVAALPHCHGECDPPGVAVRLAEDGDEYCEACVERYSMQHTTRLDWHAELPAVIAALAALDGPAGGEATPPPLAEVPTSILRRIEWHLRPNATGDSPPRTADDARWSFVALRNHTGMRIYWPEAGPWRDVRLADVRAELDLRALDARDGAT